MGELQGELQRIAGTPGLDAQGAANVWAGTSNLDLVGALNVKAGTVGVELNGVCRRLGLTYGGSSELDGQGALAAIPGIGYGGTWDAANSKQWLSGTVTNVNTATTRVVLIACVSATDWTPAATSYISGWSNCLEMGLDTAGTVRIRVDQSDSTGRTCSSSAATGFTDGTAMIRWIAADLTDAGASGTCSFYTSTNAPPNGLTNTHPGRDPSAGGAWTLLGTAARTVTSWNGTYKTAAQAVIGNFGGLQGWNGRVYYASGAIDGTAPTWELNFANTQHGATAVTDTNGIAWAATGAGISVVRA